MKLLGDAVVFRSDDEWYQVEESGAKNATVRLLSRRDWKALVSANPPLIIIRHAGDDLRPEDKCHFTPSRWEQLHV